MAIDAQCRGCGKRYDIRVEFAGKTVPCKQCGASFRVPDPAFDGFDLEEQPTRRSRPARPTRPPRSRADDDYDSYQPRNRPSRKKRSRSASGSNGGAKAALIGLGVVAGLCVVGGMGMLLYNIVGKSDSADGAPLANVTVPAFPDLPTPKVDPGSGTRIYFVDCGRMPQNADGPGMRMKMRVYLPAGNHDPKSLGCVLVAPAGTPLLYGNDMDNDDYHKETLPYAQAGYAVVFYSIDGPVRDSKNMSDAEFAAAYKKFKAAQAGVVNGRNALEFVLAKLPQVDPGRIYSAGHSSAGVLSLLLAAREPRIKAGIAYAPATDVERRLKDVRNDPASQRMLPGLNDFLHDSSPTTHVDKYECPLFVFHARDDSNEPFATTQAFVGKLKNAGKNVTFSTANRGDHYESMIREGIPKAIVWLRNLPGEQGKAAPTNVAAEQIAQHNQQQPPPSNTQEPPPSNSRRPPDKLTQRPPGSRFRPGFPGQTPFPGGPSFPGNRSRPGSRAGSRTTRGPLVSFEVRSFNGQGTPESAARRALSRYSILDASTITYDSVSKKVSARARSSSLSTGSFKSALQSQGFVIGRTSLSFK